jgi:hypothetical protein
MNKWLACTGSAGLLIVGIALTLTAAEPSGPAVTGNWVGEWGAFNPARSTEVDPALCKQLDCVVSLQDGVWSARFEGECGRPYKYSITMTGRRSGDVILFQGSADLGLEDGGVHDWIGRATAEEFIGFYSSAHHTGFFRLKKAPAATAIPAKP